MENLNNLPKIDETTFIDYLDGTSFQDPTTQKKITPAQELLQNYQLLRNYIKDVKKLGDYWCLEQGQDFIGLAIENIHKNPVYKENPKRFKEINRKISDLKTLIEKESTLRLNI